jgi:hypothetical protein
MSTEDGGEDLEFITPDDGNETEATESRDTQQATDATNDEAGDENLDDDLDLGDDDDAGGDDETEEIEVAGKKYKVHRDLKPNLMMQADYTRKTQEIAEHRRTLEQVVQAQQAREQSFAQQVQFQQQHIRGYAQLANMDQQIEQYAKYDWRQAEAQDPLTAQSHWREYQMLKDQRANLAGQLQQVEFAAREEARKQELAAQQQREQSVARQRQETERILQREIKDWNEQTATAIREYATAKAGYSVDELKNTVGDPRAFILLDKARRYDQLVEKKRQAKTPPQDQTKPLTKIRNGKAGAVTSGLNDSLSVDEWIRRRNEQVRKRAD